MQRLLPLLILVWSVSLGCSVSHHLTVTDVRDRPIAGAEVAIHRSQPTTSRRIAGQTDEAGKIRVRNIRSGETLEISKPGYRSLYLINRPFPHVVALEVGPGLPR
jgi:hypothetical protein